MEPDNDEDKNYKVIEDISYLPIQQTEMEILILDCFEQQKQKELEDALRKRIGQVDQEIEKLCKQHYHIFLDQAESLLPLRENIVSVHSQLQTLGKTIQRFNQDTVKKHHKVMQLDQQIPQLQNNKEIVQYLIKYDSILTKIKSLIQSGKIKQSLQQIRILNKNQHPNFQIQMFVKGQVLACYEELKTKLQSCLDEWFNHLQHNQRRIGKEMLELMKKEKLKKKNKLYRNQKNSQRGTSNLFSFANSTLFLSKLHSPTKPLSQNSIISPSTYSPPFRMKTKNLHTAQKLGGYSNLINYSISLIDVNGIENIKAAHQELGTDLQFLKGYINLRRQQLQQAVQLPSQPSYVSRNLGEIVGVRIVDRYLQSVVFDKYKKEELNYPQLWDKVIYELDERLKKLLRSQIIPQNIVKIKQLMLVFNQSMREFQMAQDQIIPESKKVFLNQLNLGFINQYPDFVLLVLKKMKLQIRDFLQNRDLFPIKLVNPEDLLIQSALTTIQQVFLSQAGRKKLKLGILQFLFLSNNFQYIKRSFAYQKKTLAKRLKQRVINDQQFPSRFMYKQLKMQCQDALFDCLKSKIQQLTSELQGRAWGNKVIVLGKGQYMGSLIDYLTSTLSLIQAESQQLSLICYNTAIKHAAQTIIKIICEKASCVTVVDLFMIRDQSNEIQKFVKTQVQTKFKNFDFWPCYGNLVQLTDFFLECGGVLEQYTNAYTIGQKYDLLNIGDIVKICGKFKELSSIKDERVPKLKKKELTNLLKRLK